MLAYRQSVLLPRGGPDQCQTDQNDSTVLEHEGALIRRLLSMLHATIGCVFWYRPGLRFQRPRSAEEREQACNDLIFTRGGNSEARETSLYSARRYEETPTPSAIRRIEGRLSRRAASILRMHPGEWLHKPQLWRLWVMLCAVPFAAGPLFGQAATPTFAAASIRTNRDAGPLMIPRQPLRTDPSGIHGAVCTLQDLIAFAYGIDDYRVVGGDGWVQRQAFSVDATTEVPASNEQLRVMMQRVLSARFGLRIRRESEKIPVFQLVIAEGGPRFQKLDPRETPKPNSVSAGGVTYHFPSIGYLLQILNSPSVGARRVLGRPVVDDTGLAGRYDIDLTVGNTAVQFEGQERHRIDWANLPAALKTIGLMLKPATANYTTLLIQSAHLPSPN